MHSFYDNVYIVNYNGCSNIPVGNGDTSNGKIISLYSEKTKNPAQTLKPATSPSNPQNNVTTQLLQQQQQIVNLLSSLVHLQGGQQFGSSQQTIPHKVQQLNQTAIQFPHHKQFTPIQSHCQFYA